MPQHIEQAGADAAAGVLRLFQRGGDPVRTVEIEANLFRTQAIGIFLDQFRRLGAVLLPHPHSLLRRDAEFAEIHHDLTDPVDLLEFLRELAGLCLGNPFDGTKALGSFSKISKVCSPKASTSRAASTGPIPFTAPEERYLSIASLVEGRVRSNACALNCCPKLGWFSQAPKTRSSSPQAAPGSVPPPSPTPARC